MVEGARAKRHGMRRLCGECPSEPLSALSTARHGTCFTPVLCSQHATPLSAFFLSQHLLASSDDRSQAYDRCFEECFDHFGTTKAWQLFPEVPTTLDSLRGDGFKLAILSNWDFRLQSVVSQRESPHLSVPRHIIPTM